MTVDAGSRDLVWRLLSEKHSSAPKLACTWRIEARDEWRIPGQKPEEDIKEEIGSEDQAVNRSLVVEIKAGVKAWDTRPAVEAARSLVQGKKRRDASGSLP